MFLLAKAIGRLHHTLRIAVFGSILPPLVSGSLCVCASACESFFICAVTEYCVPVGVIVCLRVFCLKTGIVFFSKLVSQCMLSNPTLFCSVSGGGLFMYWAGTNSPCSEPAAGLRQNPGPDRQYSSPVPVKPFTYSSSLYRSHGTNTHKPYHT